MSKVLGKIMGISIGGVDIDLQSHGFDENYNLIDTTDTGTTGDASENLVGRATRDLKIDGQLKLAGVPVKADAMQLLAGAVTYKVTDLNYEVNFDEVDLTDTATDPNSTEFEPGFATRKTKLDYWMLDSDPSFPRGSALASVLTFAPGITVTGDLIAETMSVVGEVKGAQKLSFNSTWQGAVVEVPTNIAGFPMAVESEIIITYKTGGSSSKSITGNAVIYGLTINGNASDVLKLSLSLKYNDAITESDYSA